MTRIATQWQQKSIGYFYGFSGTGAMKNDFYEIAMAYPEMHTYYGLLCGLFYTVPLSIAGLYSGQLTKTVKNRKMMLVAVIGMLSLF